MERSFTIKDANKNIIGILTSNDNFGYILKSIALIYNKQDEILTICNIKSNDNNIEYLNNNITIKKNNNIIDFLSKFREAVIDKIPICFRNKFNDDGKLNDEDGGTEETFAYYIDINNLYINDYSKLKFKWKNISIVIDDDIIIYIGKQKMVELEDAPEINDILKVYRFYQIQRRIESIIDYINDKEVIFDKGLF